MLFNGASDRRFAGDIEQDFCPDDLFTAADSTLGGSALADSDQELEVSTTFIPLIQPVDWAGKPKKTVICANQGVGLRSLAQPTAFGQQRRLPAPAHLP